MSSFQTPNVRQELEPTDVDKRPQDFDIQNIDGLKDKGERNLGHEVDEDEGLATNSASSKHSDEPEQAVSDVEPSPSTLILVREYGHRKFVENNPQDGSRDSPSIEFEGLTSSPVVRTETKSDGVGTQCATTFNNVTDIPHSPILSMVSTSVPDTDNKAPPSLVFPPSLPPGTNVSNHKASYLKWVEALRKSYDIEYPVLFALRTGNLACSRCVKMKRENRAKVDLGCWNTYILDNGERIWQKGCGNCIAAGQHAACNRETHGKIDKALAHNQDGSDQTTGIRSPSVMPTYQQQRPQPLETFGTLAQSLPQVTSPAPTYGDSPVMAVPLSIVLGSMAVVIERTCTAFNLAHAQCSEHADAALLCESTYNIMVGLNQLVQDLGGLSNERQLSVATAAKAHLEGSITEYDRIHTNNDGDDEEGSEIED